MTENLYLKLRKLMEIVYIIRAIKNNGWSLEYASRELKNNKNIIMRAFKNIYLID